MVEQCDFSVLTHLSPPPEKSNLTVDAVKLHNELQSGSLRLERASDSAQFRMEEDSAEEAATEKSSGTFLSGLSDCTNITFSKVQRFWESNSAAHKEVWTGAGLGNGVFGGDGPLAVKSRDANLLCWLLTDLCRAGSCDRGDPLPGRQGERDRILCCTGECWLCGRGARAAAAGSVGGL